MTDAVLQAAALVAYAAFIAVAVGWRTWLQYRTTGDAGLRILRGGPRELTAAALFLLGFGLAPLGPVLVLLGWLERTPVSAAGLVLMVLGSGLTVIAQLHMGASWRIGVDRDEATTLVTTGVFALVRNPIFTGILLVVAGLLLSAPSVLGATALALTWIGIQLQVRGVEEPHLLRTHGERYRAYARRTGRFVPGLGRLD
jgi:protein-S-isoprenylcysteine O-methyltransferase Ste14